MLDWRGKRDGLDPAFAQDIDDTYGPDAGNWAIVQGLRTREYQAGLYAIWLKWLEDHPNEDPKNGPRAAPPGSSAHEKGRAVDFTEVINCKDTWRYQNANWRRLVALAKAHPRLHSLDAIGDTDHVERVHWRDN